VAVHNRGGQPLTIVHPDYWGVTEIEIVDAKGKRVEPTTFKGERKAFANLLTIPPGETKTHRFDHLTAWTCCYGYTFHPLPPGRYEIKVRLTNPPVKVEPPTGWKPGWTGTLTSNSLAIEIRR
jgi:hypothetical protein